jgi:hypothetical protein
MRSDTVIKHEGFDAIFNKLDIVEAERFFALIKRDKFDYTELRKNLFEDLSTDELSKKAMDFWKTHNK